MGKKYIVTIDGSGWTGKSTISKFLSEMLGYKHLNTGLMFRSVAYLMSKNNIHSDQIGDINELLNKTRMEFKIVNDQSRLFVDGEDFTEMAKDNSLVPLACEISTIPEVRESLINLQRDICKEGGFVVEGRDTGTVVFPDAKWKFFLNASLDVKIKRFFKMLPENQKNNYSYEEVLKIVEDTDRRDRERKIAPLKKSSDAIEYDNSLSPSAERDAAIIWYYINHKQQIIENSRILSLKE